jgi:HAMP domain
VRLPFRPTVRTRLALLLVALVVVTGTRRVGCGLAWLVAGRITGEDLHERLGLGGPADELTELGDTFDAMLARLEAAFTDQQLFAANAAHRLGAGRRRLRYR